MNIYVDFDDCLCESGKFFSGLVREMFGLDVPYEKMRYFNLQQAFGLTDEQYRQLLVKGHEPGLLLSYEETPGASDVINEWIRKGYDVSIITGRPYSSYEASRLWLDRHGMRDARMLIMDKYGRETAARKEDYILDPEDYYRMKFDYAVEDSPSAFRFFDHLPQLKVLVFDRPWNRTAELPDNYTRCRGWEEIRANAVAEDRR